MKCYICNEELNALEQSFLDNFQKYKEGVKIALCSDCALNEAKAKVLKDEFR